MPVNDTMIHKKNEMIHRKGWRRMDGKDHFFVDTL